MTNDYLPLFIPIKNTTIRKLLIKDIYNTEIFNPHCTLSDITPLSFSSQPFIFVHTSHTDPHTFGGDLRNIATDETSQVITSLTIMTVITR